MKTFHSFFKKNLSAGGERRPLPQAVRFHNPRRHSAARRVGFLSLSLMFLVSLAGFFPAAARGAAPPTDKAKAETRAQKKLQPVSDPLPAKRAAIFLKESIDEKDGEKDGEQARETERGTAASKASTGKKEENKEKAANAGGAPSSKKKASAAAGGEKEGAEKKKPEAKDAKDAKPAAPDAVSLYNNAADHLSKGETEQAFLRFERACANHIYLPACRALQMQGAPAPIAPLIWILVFIAFALLTLALIAFLFFSKRGASFKIRLTSFVAWNLLLLILNQTGAAALRPGGRTVQSCELHAAPIEGAPVTGSMKKGETFTAFKNYREEWFKIKTADGRGGWVAKENLYWTKR